MQENFSTINFTLTILNYIQLYKTMCCNGEIHIMYDTILQKKNKFNRISGSTLKIIATFCMLLDHISAIILSNLSTNTGNVLMLNISRLLRIIGRISFPIFCFLLIEGMLHTRNRKKYALRLGLFALISEVPFNLAFGRQIYFPQAQNVFFTLLIGLLVIIAFEEISKEWKDKKWYNLLVKNGIFLSGLMIILYINSTILEIINSVLRLLGNNVELVINDILFIVLSVMSILSMIVLYKILSKKYCIEKANKIFAQLGVLFVGSLTAVIFQTDYYDWGIFAIAIMYKLHNDSVKSIIGACTILIMLSISEIWAFFDVLLVGLYNGKRGINVKYLFYIFYPAHLLLLYILSILIIKS